MSDLLMEMAWRDFILWAVQDGDVLAQYKEETGKTMDGPASGLEAAIDEATGYAESQANDFVIWDTKRLWGVEEAPQRLRAELERQKRPNRA